VRSIAAWYYCIASRVRPSALIGLAAAQARALGLLEIGDGLARLLVEALRHAAGQDERGIRRGLHRPADFSKIVEVTRKVAALIGYYDNQSDDEAIAEAEAAYRKRTTALVEVPVKLLPAVRELIARQAG